ncbi:hypothetical protein M758_2G104100 [Ceratodon purpureus]|nr:hypothetical protein M758_2G104100 [Ceratodon purpureus]
MAATGLVQRSRSSFTTITATRQHFFDRSSSRSSFLALRSQRLTQGSTTALRLHNEPTRRNTSGVARSSLEKQKVKETLEFYIHEIRSADPDDKTATLKLANLPPNTNPLQWGSSFVFDNEVREGLGADSKLLGRERGWGVVTDQNSEEGLQLISKISFTEGKFNGSTITFSGNVGGKETPYELIVHGGTGHFRGAHGYVLAENAPNDGPRFIFHWKVFLL